jgi:hypothetical protein
MTPVLGIPLLVLGAGGLRPTDSGSCQEPPLASGQAAPAITGQSVLDSEQLTSWWEGLRRGQPAGLHQDVAYVIALYLDEGATEGVRGDLAFAQAIHETGYFTSADVGRNNFAGIVHPDGVSAGATFPDVATGIRAHVQLLKKFAAGNGTPLATLDVTPPAGARARTWADLASTWASDPSYWTSIASIYRDMSGPGPASDTCAADQATTSRPVGDHLDLVAVDGITVDTSIADALSALLAEAKHDGLVLNGSGYRSHDQQIGLRRSHCGSSNYAIYEMPSSQCSPPTARPGNSLHEQGLAIDFVNCSTHSTACWQWLNSHAATYGFFNLPSEPWHWSITGA